MQNLKQALKEAQERKVAVGHFNIANLTMLKAIFESAQEVSELAGYKIPVIIGASEGERDFVGVDQIVDLIKSFREDYDYPIFLNADHTASVERSKEAIDAGFDMVIIDNANKPLEENIKNTKEVVDYAKSKNYQGLIEGEVGYIGSGSKVIEDIPEGAAITEDAIASVADAKRYVEETGVDLLSPAVGNIHGMLAKGKNPHLFVDRIEEIKQAVDVPLVLHGASGIPDEDFGPAISHGINMIHISTEIRRAWRKGMDEAMKKNPDQIAPYKIAPSVIEEIKKVVTARIKLFNNLS